MLLKPTEVSCGSSKMVFWKCSRGHSWEKSVKKIVEGYKCPYCSNRKIIVGFNDLKTLFPEVALEWSSKNVLSSEQVVPGDGRKYWWDCVSCGFLWEARVSSRSYGSHGCPRCANKVVSVGVNDLFTVKPFYKEEWCFELNDFISPYEITVGCNKKVWWKCSDCEFLWKACVAKRACGGQGCPKCARRISRLEEIVNSYVEEEFPSVYVVRRSRPLVSDSGGRFEIDFLFPKFKLGFEVQDFASHSKDTEGEACSFGDFKKGPFYHEFKRRLALEQLGVRIVDLWEDDVCSGAFKSIVDRELKGF